MLSLYLLDSSTNQFVELSKNGDLSQIVHNVFNGADGGAVLTKLYIRNKDLANYYTDIVIQPGPSESVSPANAKRLSVKILSGDREPSLSDWSARVSGDPIRSTANYDTASPRNWYIPEIGNASIGDVRYHPFWLRVEYPPKTRVGVDTSIYLNIEAEESIR